MLDIDHRPGSAQFGTNGLDRLQAAGGGASALSFLILQEANFAQFTSRAGTSDRRSAYTVNQAELEATLTTAEAVLARTVINAVDVGAGWVATAATLDKVRGCCRELRSALYQLRCSESADDLDIARKCCREIRSVLLELNRSASIPFRCLDPSCSLLATPRRTCWCNSLEDTLSGPLRLEAASGRADSLPPPLPEHIVRPTDIGYRAQAPVAADTRVWPRLLRQGSELLALILAYLNLYFIDVELDILRMPSMFVAALP